MQTILVKNLCKNFGTFSLSNINLQVSKGEFLALIGENGAGKTTLLSLIGGLLKPSKGEIFIMGKNVTSPKVTSKLIGFVHQYISLPELLKVKEVLTLEARMRNLKQDVVEEALELAGLNSYWNTKIFALSEGCKRKVAVVKPLLHHPPVLLLDEPTVGLDPITRENIWKYLLKLKKTGLTAIISTNYLDEAEYLCDRVVFIINGSIAVERSINELKSLGQVIVVTLKEKNDLEDIPNYLLKKHENIFLSITLKENRLEIVTKIKPYLALPIIVNCIIEKNLHIMSISCMENSLERILRNYYKKEKESTIKN